VLIHGWGSDSQIWQAWAEATFVGYRLTLIDLPGHGKSTELNAADTRVAEVWQEALLAVMPTRAIVVGWSLGGLLAQRLALAHPERVSALLLIASSPCFVQKSGWLPALEQSLFARYLSEVMTQTLTLLKSFVALQTLGSQKPKQLLKQLLPLLTDTLTTHHGALKQGLQLLEQLDLRQEIDRLSMPTLWLLGEQDAIVPVALAKLLPSLQPQAQIQLVAEAGHLPFLSAAEDTTTLVTSFLQGISRD
jgi:pimeloyl-[acyl-carrier protein] methyl ester esterase